MEISNHPPILWQDFSKLDLDLLFLPGLDGENPYLKKALSGIFKQGGVTGLAHNIFINLACLLGINQFGLGHLAVYLHLELVYGCALWDGKDECALKTLSGRVEEDLPNVSGCHLFDNGSLHLQTSGFKW